jgi:hypothetical protein
MSTTKAKILQDSRKQSEVFSQALKDDAAKKGVELVTRVSVFPVSQFPDWPTKLAEALCQDPTLADQPNQKLVSVLEARSGKTGFNLTAFSKPLSASQRNYASEVLRQHGYSPANMIKGTDIKRIVRDQVRGPAKSQEATVFFADGLSIDGRTYQYRQRNTTPTGNAWQDFCIRIRGAETPLHTVLVLRNVSIGEFQNKDEAAMMFASEEQKTKRQQLNREAKVHRGMPRLVKR